MTQNNLTHVTFYRARLDPLDLYRLDDILRNDGPDCYDTPAAALATHLHARSPEMYWGENIIPHCEEMGLESDSLVLLAAKFQASHGPRTVFVNLVSVNGSASRARQLHFSAGLFVPTSAVLQACSMGSGPQQPDSTGVVALHNTKSRFSPDVAYGLATRTKPLVVPTTITIATGVNFKSAPDAATDPVEGFTQVPGDSPLWSAPLAPAPGTDMLSGCTEEDKPAAIMASIVQGDGYVPQVNLVSPEK